MSESIASKKLDETVRLFVKSIVKKSKFNSRSGVLSVVHKNACVHAEIYLASYLRDGDIPVFPYLGVSKLSCDGCNLFLNASATVTSTGIYTCGTHGKFYASWPFPSFKDGETHEKVRSEMIRIELARALLSYINEEHFRKLSDSSTGSADSDSIQVSNTPIIALPSMCVFTPSISFT